MTRYLVQRRLSGTQGKNGCFADVGVYEADDERAAVLSAATKENTEGEYRSASEPDWKYGYVGFESRSERWPVFRTWDNEAADGPKEEQEET